MMASKGSESEPGVVARFSPLALPLAGGLHRFGFSFILNTGPSCPFRSGSVHEEDLAERRERRLRR